MWKALLMGAVVLLAGCSQTVPLKHAELAPVTSAFLSDTPASDADIVNQITNNLKTY